MWCSEGGPVVCGVVRVYVVLLVRPFLQKAVWLCGTSEDGAVYTHHNCSNGHHLVNGRTSVILTV